MRDTAVDDLNKDKEHFIWKTWYVLKEEKDQIYEAYLSFHRIMGDNSVSMTHYIIDSEQRYSRMRNYKMELLDVVLAFKLLDM